VIHLHPRRLKNRDIPSIIGEASLGYMQACDALLQVLFISPHVQEDKGISNEGPRMLCPSKEKCI